MSRLLPLTADAPLVRLYGSLLARRGWTHPVREGPLEHGRLDDLWRTNEVFRAALLLDAHDRWAPLARRRPRLGWRLRMGERHTPLGPRLLAEAIETPHAAIPLLALDLAIPARLDGPAYMLDALMAFAGRWRLGRLAELPARPAMDRRPG